MGRLHRMSRAQSKRVRTLIRRLCANCDNGSCLLLDDGDPCPCPQMISPTLICKYFRAAVLPADRELHAEIIGGIQNWKRCAVCGRRFIARSNRALYCDRCTQQEQRNRTRERVRRYRGRL